MLFRDGTQAKKHATLLTGYCAMETEAYRTDVAAVAASLQTNVYKGLAHAEAASRLLGPNELTGKRPLPSEVPGAVHRKLAQFS